MDWSQKVLSLPQSGDVGPGFLEFVGVILKDVSVSL